MNAKLVAIAVPIIVLAGCNKNASQPIGTSDGPMNASATDNDVIAEPATPPAKRHHK